MEYQSLYRRYRPQTFGQVRGQRHVVRALQNAVREGRVGHAYLLSGPRGTGKTTLARVLAKVLNCDNPVEGEPCGQCPSCKAIEAGTSFDLHELDAASNNKVDDMRDLLSKVALGTPGRSKVYLLDEVHMLSAGAENALLKTLEEPPDHVVFILATTEPHKVVATIRSRTQHLELSLLGADEMAEHVRWIAADASLPITDEIVDHVVRVGGGSVRDTLSALDQVIAAGGVAHDDSTVADLLTALAERDPARALATVAEATRIGRDPRVIGESLIDALRLVFLTSMHVELPQATDRERAQAATFAETLTPATLTRALEMIGTALVNMRQAPDPRVDLEVALVRLTRGADPADDLPALAPLLDRIERLERALAAGAGAASSAPSPRAAAATAPAAAPGPPPPRRAGPAEEARQRLSTQRGRAAAPPPAPAPAPAPATAPTPAPAPAAEAPARSRPPEPVPAPAAEAPATGDLAALWSGPVLAALAPGLRAFYNAARFVDVDGDTVVLALPNDVHRNRCDERRAEVEAAFERVAGRAVRLRLVTKAEPVTRGGAASPPPIEPDDNIDLDELTDAPALGTLVDQVVATFPGAELIDD